MSSNRTPIPLDGVWNGQKEKLDLHLQALLDAFRLKIEQIGDPDAIRTRGVPLRRRTLYPAEVRDHVA